MDDEDDIEQQQETPGAYLNELLNDVTKSDVLEASNPIFDPSFVSSKLFFLLKVLKEKFIDKKNKDKIIIVSEWVVFLDIIEEHISGLGLTSGKFTGEVPIEERNELVERFNNPEMGPKVLLLSLCAGGVGLNLTGANHLFMMTVHWNPQLEKQAEDRIYRVGQTKPVTIYKFRATGTIEERIVEMQFKKINMANQLLLGGSVEGPNRLTISDLKKLFGLDNFSFQTPDVNDNRNNHS